MATVENLQAAATLQSRLCAENGSPTWAAVIDELNARLEDADQPAVRLLLRDDQDPIGSAVLLRLLGAVHRILLNGQRHELAEYLPTLGGSVDPPRAVEAFLLFVAEHQETLQVQMQFSVQTNEVGRSAILSAGLRWLASQVDLPMTLLEVGASAGLNLHLDQYRVHMGDQVWGSEASLVDLKDNLQSGRPEGKEFRILDRAGCDLAPIDASSTEGQLRLRSFIWPEDTTRMNRLDAALAMFEPVTIEACPAPAWVRTQLSTSHIGRNTVVMHSIVMPYLTTAEKQDFGDAIAQAGACSTEHAPIAWLRMEPTGTYSQVSLEVDIWPGGRREVLATCTPHGANINWHL
ncbi:MAG: DUF2332 domain-containing protein [Actinomycetota bacterium]|nr:DUF2332 domain-containing protein [Actinomycetota bacterium]